MSRNQTEIFFLLSVYHQPLDLQLGDIWYHMEPGEPLEVSDGRFYVEKLMEIYGKIYGIIVMEQVKTRTGITLDTDAEIDRATKHLKQCETDMLQEWVVLQQTTRIPANLPILPPMGRVAEIIKTRKVDLKKKYNFNIPGNDAFEDKEKDALIEENKRLKAEVAGFQAMQDTILDRLNALETTKSTQK